VRVRGLTWLILALATMALLRTAGQILGWRDREEAVLQEDERPIGRNAHPLPVGAARETLLDWNGQSVRFHLTLAMALARASISSASTSRFIFRRRAA